MKGSNRFAASSFLLVFAWMTAFCAADPASVQENTVLNTVKKEHPRLILTSQDIPRLNALIQNDKTAQQIYARLKEEADQLLNQKTVEYIIEGPRLLTQSRRCLDRVYKLSLVYLLDGDEKYLHRAVAEMQAASDFPDWNPSHFLDTAEMTHAFAIGYDWLYSHLTDSEKTMIRTALVEKGLNAYLEGFAKEAWYIHSQHNWNQVTNGGIGIGALAVADEVPETAAKVLTISIQHLPLALQHYAPDGGWNEGPGYWHYATRYTVYFLASLNSALGTDFGLSAYPGMENAGQFRIDFQSPTGLCFNYADAGSRVGDTHEMFWLAQRYNRPVYAWMERQDLRSPDALDLVWYTPIGDDPQTSKLPLDSYYKGINVTFFRSAWNDRNALFAGFKGGDNKANHSHLDLGSFVLDALGERWGVDLGSDNYNMPDYFGKSRWTYFRLINESHNTLTIDGQNQDPKAEAPILKFSSTPDWACAIADLSEAYPRLLQKAQRGMAMIGRKQVLVQDEIQTEKPADVMWTFMTAASITLDGQTATLEQHEKYLCAQILAPKDARFEIMDATPPKPQNPNKGMKRLVVRLPQQTQTCLVVRFTPYTDKNQPPSIEKTSIKPLEQW